MCYLALPLTVMILVLVAPSVSFADAKSDALAYARTLPPKDPLGGALRNWAAGTTAFDRLENDDHRAVPFLRRRLEELPTKLTLEFFTTRALLARMGERDQFEAIVADLKSDDLRIVRESALSLVRVGPAEAAEALVDLYDDPRPSKRYFPHDGPDKTFYQVEWEVVSPRGSAAEALWMLSGTGDFPPSLSEKGEAAAIEHFELWRQWRDKSRQSRRR